MSKKKKARHGNSLEQKLTPLAIAEKAIRRIAIQEHTTPDMVRKHIQISMLSGLMSENPDVQAQWKRIPCVGEIPTPEEVIAFYAEELSTN